MKIILSKEEMADLIKRSFPKEMIPPDQTVTAVKLTGYPEVLEITFEKFEKKEADAEE